MNNYYDVHSDNDDDNDDIYRDEDGKDFMTLMNW